MGCKQGKPAVPGTAPPAPKTLLEAGAAVSQDVPPTKISNQERGGMDFDAREPGAHDGHVQAIVPEGATVTEDVPTTKTSNREMESMDADVQQPGAHERHLQTETVSEETAAAEGAATPNHAR